MPWDLTQLLSGGSDNRQSNLTDTTRDDPNARRKPPIAIYFDAERDPSCGYLAYLASDQATAPTRDTPDSKIGKYSCLVIVMLATQQCT